MARKSTSKRIDIALPSHAAVTGGSGFIGSHVVRRLLKAGSKVSVLVMPGDGAPLLDGLDVRKVRGDVASGDGLGKLLDGADGVFHLAAIYALWLPRPERMFEVNVGGTRNVIAAARKHGIKRVVHTSSIAAVGYRKGKQASDESCEFNGWGIADGYVMSKYISGLEARAASRDGIDVVCVNPAFPLGHGDIAPTPTGQIVKDILSGRLPFAVSGGLNVVDVRDVADGHLLAWRHGRAGERYILGGENLENRQLFAAICEEAGKKAPMITIPARPLKAAGRLMEHVANRITHRPPMLTERSVAYTAGRFLYFDTRKARTELGHSARPAAEAIASSVAWFRGVTG